MPVSNLEEVNDIWMEALGDPYRVYKPNDSIYKEKDDDIVKMTLLMKSTWSLARGKIIIY